MVVVGADQRLEKGRLGEPRSRKRMTGSKLIGHRTLKVKAGRAEKAEL